MPVTFSKVQMCKLREFFDQKKKRFARFLSVIGAHAFSTTVAQFYFSSTAKYFVTGDVTSSIVEKKRKKKGLTQRKPLMPRVKLLSMYIFFSARDRNDSPQVHVSLLFIRTRASTPIPHRLILRPFRLYGRTNGLVTLTHRLGEFSLNDKIPRANILLSISFSVTDFSDALVFLLFTSSYNRVRGNRVNYRSIRRNRNERNSLLR